MLTRRIPTATYRLQFNKDFTFQNACAILDYLCELGISDIYASPILTSRRGSGHGYDVTDPTRIDADLGSEADFEAFQQELQCDSGLSCTWVAFDQIEMVVGKTAAKDIVKPGDAG